MLLTREGQVSLWKRCCPRSCCGCPRSWRRWMRCWTIRRFRPFVPFFDPRLGRPSTRWRSTCGLMFLKFRYEILCREVADSISWRRLCRIPLDGKVPHPSTLMKLTTRCGTAAVEGCNEALLAKPAQAKLLRSARVRADTTVVAANVVYRTDSGAAGQGGSGPAVGRRSQSYAGCAARPGRRVAPVSPRQLPGRVGPRGRSP